MKKTLILVLVLVLALNGLAALAPGDTTLIRECVTSASLNSLLLQYCSAAILPILIVNKILAEEASSPLSGHRKRPKDAEPRPRTSFIRAEPVKFEKQDVDCPAVHREQEDFSGPAPSSAPGNAREGTETLPLLFLLLYCIVLSLSNLPAPLPVRSCPATVPIRPPRFGAFLFGQGGAA